MQLQFHTSTLGLHREKGSKWKILYFYISDKNKSPLFDQKVFDLIQNMAWLFYSRHTLSDLVCIAEFCCKALDLSETFRLRVDVEGFKEINLT